MKIDWENVDNIGAVYSKNGEQVNAINTIYVEYKDGRLGKFTYPEGVPLDELKNIKELADSQKLTLKMFDSNSERDTKEIELYEYDLKVQEFMDETEALVIDNRGEKGIAYIKKRDGSIEKRPYSPIMDKFIYESLEAKKQGKFGKFFEIDEGPEAEKRVEALEEVMARKEKEDFEDIYSGRDLDEAYNTFKDKDNEENTNTDVDTNNPDDKDTEEVKEVKKDEDSKDIEEKLEKKYDNKNKAIIAAIIGGTVAAGAGIAAIANSCDRNTGKETDFTNKSFESLMNSMKKDDERRVFAENVFSVTEALNSKALDKNVFALEEDGEATLHFTYDEVAAAKLVLNNYTSEEMYEIFGTDEIDTNDIMAKYQSFTTKMSLYAMNGKAPSGVASLIENEANRTWFEKIENSIVEFNKAPNSTNADKVIRTFAYFYNHGINGSDGIENDEATLACVKNLAFNMIRGYRDANGEKDYQQYLVVSTEPGSFDDQYRTNKESQVQKGERLSDHIKIAESGPCTIQNVRSHIESLVERLATGRIEKKDKKEKSSRPSYTEIRKAAASTIGSNMKTKDDVLYMNRIRGLIRINSKDGSEYTVTKEVWDKMTTEERLDFAKKNGKVISNTKKTTTEKIDKSKLTDEEKKEADKQKTYEVNGHRFNSVETAEAYKQGYLAAHNYANEEGAYKHSAIYNAIDVDNPYVVIEEDAGTLNDVVKNRYAYEKRETLLTDSQIQRRLEKEVKNYRNSGSNVNDNMVNAFMLGLTDGISDALEADMKNGELERKEAERLYKEAQEEAKRENEKTPTEDENEKPGNSEGDIPTYDENDPDPYLRGPNQKDVDPGSLSKSYNAMNEAELDIYNSFETENNDTYEADPEIEVSEEDLDSYINNEVKVLSLKR